MMLIQQTFIISPLWVIVFVCVPPPKYVAVSAFTFPLVQRHWKCTGITSGVSTGFFLAQHQATPKDDDVGDFYETSGNSNSSNSTTTTTTSITAETLTALEAIDIKTATTTTMTTTDIDSPVLQKVFPDMLRHCQQYGHPNIPLGSTAGRQCETLRRLQIQQKLSARDVALLEQIQFRFYSLEQVYQTANFDELLQRLEAYAATKNINEDDCWSPPKKYAPDPELGAWVTGLRRMGRDKVDPAHVAALEARSGGRFEWTSPRKCGSQFMKQYRALQKRLLVSSSSSSSSLNQNDNDNDDNDNGSATTITTNDKNDQQDIVWNDQQAMVWNDPAVQQWVQAQQEAAKRGTLSETRKHYMAQLLRSQQNDDWIEQERPWETSSL